MKFKPEDFDSMDDTDRCPTIDAAELANAKLQAWLDAAPEVYSLKAQYCKEFSQRWRLLEQKKDVSKIHDVARLILMKE